MKADIDDERNEEKEVKVKEEVDDKDKDPDTDEKMLTCRLMEDMTTKSMAEMPRTSVVTPCPWLGGEDQQDYRPCLLLGLGHWKVPVDTTSRV